MTSNSASRPGRPSSAAPRPAASGGSRPAAALLLACLLTAALAGAGAAVAEIGPTIYIGGVQDLRPGYASPSKCSQLVDAAAEYSFRRVQVLVSVLWWDVGPLDPPPGYSGCENYTLSSEAGGPPPARVGWAGRPHALACAC